MATIARFEKLVFKIISVAIIFTLPSCGEQKDSTDNEQLENYCGEEFRGQPVQ